MMFWVADTPPTPDTYAAFRGEFTLEAPAEVELLVFGVSWFVCWLDGEYLTEGPARFAPGHAEHETLRVALPAGKHVLAIQAHYEGVDTRILLDTAPFILCSATIRGSPREITWTGIPLPAYAPQVRRISAELGWVEWCDTRQLPGNGQAPDFDASGWPAVAVQEATQDINALPLGKVQRIPHALTPMAEGPVANFYGYEQDDPPARFFLRDLVCEDVPPQGLWRRYDLGRVRLGYPQITLEAPAGAVVEMAYAEALSDGRVAPYISLSGSPSANMDHYVARGGVQTFGPMMPRSGRFLEVHVLAAPEQMGDIRFVNETFVERSYYGEPEGRFTCSDARLNRIWQMGVETLRACSEDAVISGPTRGRGAWLADVAVAGLEVAGVAYRDLRPLRRALVQYAQCARDDGMVAAVAPGEGVYFANSAAQWATACVDYYRITGDRSLLVELWRPALRNIAALERDPSEPGITEDIGYTFIDRSYVPPDSPMDLALNLHFLEALVAMTDWANALGKSSRELHTRAEALRQRLDDALLAIPPGGEGEGPGFHATVLALDQGLYAGDAARKATEAIKRHIIDCFPNDPCAPRLTDSMQRELRVISPYFMHYALRALAEHGEMPFVLDQYRTCWGWALDQGFTTCPEVFDPRWSLCHVCSACPTWQLSRYALGLRPRFERGMNHFDFRLIPSDLEWAEGALPLPEGEVKITWKREDGVITYTLDPSLPVYVTGLPGATEAVEVTGERTWVWE